MNSEQRMVQEFHLKYGHPVAVGLCLPDDATLLLRSRLIVSEAAEFVDAASNGDGVEMADALADILYVVYGTAVVLGIDLEKVFSEVHRSNMSKSTEKDAGGKTIKGPDYGPPDIAGVLAKQGEAVGEAQAGTYCVACDEVLADAQVSEIGTCLQCGSVVE
jgi:predicted HAD superfamily Cof-like phosphohydrolase